MHYFSFYYPHFTSILLYRKCRILKNCRKDYTLNCNSLETTTLLQLLLKEMWESHGTFYTVFDSSKIFSFLNSCIFPYCYCGFWFPHYLCTRNKEKMCQSLLTSETFFIFSTEWAFVNAVSNPPHQNELNGTQVNRDHEMRRQENVLSCHYQTSNPTK